MATPLEISEQGNSLTFFPLLPTDVKGPTKKSSLLDIFKKPKEKSNSEIGKDVFLKSDLEGKEQEEVSTHVRSKFYVHHEPKPSPNESRSVASGVKGRLEFRQKVKSVGHSSGSEELPIPLNRDEATSEAHEYRARPPRSLSLVMKQISNIRKGLEHDGSSSDVRWHWMPDSQCKECYECGEKFTTFRRRHHCRVCGQVFCNSCCNQEVASNSIGLIAGERVCSYCDKVLRSYTNPEDTSDDLSAFREDLKKLTTQEGMNGAHVTPRKNLSSITIEERKQRTGSLLESDPSDPNPFEPAASSDRGISDNLDSEWQLLLQDSAQLRDLWLLIQHPSNGICPQTHRHRLRTYPNCIIGSELVDWLILKDKATNRVQATAIGQALLAAGWLRYVPGKSDDIFRDDNVLYNLWQRVRPKTSSEATLTEDGELSEKTCLTEPNWFQEIEGDQDRSNNVANVDGLDNVFSVKGLPSSADLGSVDGDSASITSRGTVPSDTDADSQTRSEVQGLTSLLNNPKIQHLMPNALPISPDKEDETIEDGSERGEADLKRQFRHSSVDHIKVLLSQLLEKDNLDVAWFDILFNLAQTLCNEVKIDVFAKDLMDIRQYVHIKKLPGGSREECEIIHGIVCTKNITNKKMVSDLKHPNILLLASAVEHQRIENKFVSLEPVVLQERDFLKNCVSKLIAKKPDVLIVEKTVARVAQEFILANGITLISNTKPLVMARIKRSTGASLEETIEQATQATLGSCNRFYLKVFPLPGGYSKTLMFIQGCPPRLGCSVLLRGGSLRELKKVKHCLQLMIYALYHSVLEAAYLFDSYALPMEETEEVLSSPGTEDSQGLSGSFFEGMKLQPKDQSSDESQENQRSVSESIRSAMQKLMKSQSSKDGPNVEHEKEGGESVSNPAERATATTSTINGEGKAVVMTGSKAPEKQKPQNGGSAEITKDRSKNSGEVIEVESKIIPFTPLVAPSGVSVTAFTGALTLATPIKVNHFSRVLKERKLSSSPHLAINPPFFETDQGKGSPSRKFFSEPIFSSPLLSSGNYQKQQKADVANTDSSKREIERDGHYYRSLDRSTKPSREVVLKGAHPFVEFPYLSDEDKIPALVADFRAKGGRLVSRSPRHHQSLDALGSAPRKKDDKSTSFPSGSQTLPSQFKGDEYQEDNFGTPSSSSSSSPSSVTTKSQEDVDCLDPYFHQRLTTQFSSFSLMSENAPNYCIHPRTIHMEHYGRNDVTLGHFLDKFCFNTLYTCRSKTCDTFMLQHIRRFVHDHGCVEVILRVTEEPVAEDWDDVIVWSWCRRCQEVLPYQKLSSDTWKMSFSKYLELRFMAKDYTSRFHRAECHHSLHLHHNQYFSRGKIVATFKYHPINVRDVMLPPLPFPDHKPFLTIPDPEAEYSNLNEKGTNLLSSILQNITIMTEIESGQSCTHLEDKRAEFCGMYEDHQMTFKKHMGGLREKISELESTRDNAEDREAKLLPLQDACVDARRSLARIGMAWDKRFQDFLFIEKERKRREQNRKKIGEDGYASPKSTYSASHEEEPQPFLHSQASAGNSIPVPKIAIETNQGSIQVDDQSGGDKESLGEIGEDDGGSIGTSAQEESQDEKNNLNISKDNISVSSSASGEQLGMEQTDSRPSYSRVRSMLNSFKADQTTPIKLDMPFPPDQHYILPPCNIPSIIIFDKEPSSIIAYTLSSDKYKIDLLNLEAERRSQLLSSSSKRSSGRTSPAGISKGSDKSDGTKNKILKQKSTKKVLNFLWSKGNASGLSDRLDPTPDESEAESDFGGNTPLEEEGDLDMNKSGKDLENAPSILWEYEDPTHSQFWCQVYYPSEFAHLRQLLFPSGEDVFIRSLSRCKTWKATGGKSGSKFSKTEDDRFVLKEIQRTESHFFLQFAPNYIKYMEKATFNNQPTALAKILGFFTIGCKNPVTGTAEKQHVIVMENLFYKRHISKIFDLKGSVRNRHVKTSGVEDPHAHVLMDENLIKEMVKSPLYIPLHSKSILGQAFESDTKLLAKHFVMDYSLLVGIDEGNNQLVVGIIDYIRKFTFDKKLEMIVKTSGIVGGHGKTPTIVSPELYRSRFCDAMDKYFVLVPDRWTGLGKDYFTC